MARYKIVVQYDGSHFFGWQMQIKVRSVQAELEQALLKLAPGGRTPVTGAGRTDSGVHALGQVAHFDLDTRLRPGELLRALNGNLPVDVRIRSCAVVADDFHARFAARSRTYLYRCREDDYLLDRLTVWRTGPLQLELLDQMAAMVSGEHDFTGFCKYRPDQDNYRCSVYQSAWKEAGDLVIYEVTANRFLHHMVRYLVGSMVAVARGRETLEHFQNRLENPGAKSRVYRAPAQGLILASVAY